MNTLLLLAQGAANMADSLATANPVLTTVNAPAEMNMLDMAGKGGWVMIVLGGDVSIFYSSVCMLFGKPIRKIRCLWIKSRIIFIVGRSNRPLIIAVR